MITRLLFDVYTNYCPVSRKCVNFTVHSIMYLLSLHTIRSRPVLVTMSHYDTSLVDVSYHLSPSFHLPFICLSDFTKNCHICDTTYYKKIKRFIDY